MDVWHVHSLVYNTTLDFHECYTYKSWNQYWNVTTKYFPSENTNYIIKSKSAKNAKNLNALKTRRRLKTVLQLVGKHGFEYSKIESRERTEIRVLVTLWYNNTIDLLLGVRRVKLFDTWYWKRRDRWRGGGHGGGWVYEKPSSPSVATVSANAARPPTTAKNYTL